MDKTNLVIIFFVTFMVTLFGFMFWMAFSEFGEAEEAADVSPEEHEGIFTSTGTEKGAYMSIGGRIAVRDFRATGDIKGDKLSGEGNAFACVDSEGKLYRSLAPCR